MKILFLGSSESSLVQFLRDSGHEVMTTQEKLDLESLQKLDVSLLISFGYRHLIRKEVLDAFPKRVLNLHISYLPWNRGADPNFWSFFDDTPKGVTIHYVDEGLDTGEIIAQREVAFEPTETLRSSYEKLQASIVQLFQENWNDILTGKCSSRPQSGPGTCHRTRDKEPYAFLTQELGYETPVKVISDYGSRRRS